ncbi:hypothetical protein ABG983_09065, partial [Collinsella aerofaciens]
WAGIARLFSGSTNSRSCQIWSNRANGKARLTSGGHMRDVAESDWKLFKKMLPQWQERYMEKLIGQYVEILNGDSEASSRFWALEERLNRDKLSSGVIANDIRRSTMHREIANLLIDSVITLDDLDGFTEDIKSYAQHWIGQ